MKKLKLIIEKLKSLTVPETKDVKSGDGTGAMPKSNWC